MTAQFWIWLLVALLTIALWLGCVEGLYRVGRRWVRRRAVRREIVRMTGRMR